MFAKWVLFVRTLDALQPNTEITCEGWIYYSKDKTEKLGGDGEKIRPMKCPEEAWLQSLKVLGLGTTINPEEILKAFNEELKDKFEKAKTANPDSPDYATILEDRDPNNWPKTKEALKAPNDELEKKKKKMDGVE